MQKKVSESFFVYGHFNISGKHETTIEFTKENFLTPSGDCIIGIKSTKCFEDFSPEFLKLLKLKTKITCILEINGLKEKIEGYGHPELTHLDKNTMIIRKSEFKCNRTLMIKANKASHELHRDLINQLKEPNSKMKVTISVQEEN